MPILKRPALQLREAALNSDVCRTLECLAAQTPNGALIGTLAMNFHRQLRYRLSFTMLFGSDADIELPLDFVRRSPVLCINRATGVKVLTFTPKTSGIPNNVVRRVLDTAKLFDGMRVATAEGLAVVKLYASLSRRRMSGELADVQDLLECYPEMDLMDWSLPAELQRRLDGCRALAEAPQLPTPAKAELEEGLREVVLHGH
jgi:hypothetical protein